MANPVKGETPLKLDDGREFTLVMDFEGLVEAEGAYGKPMERMMQDAAAGFMGASRALLFGALQAHHPEMTLRDASNILGRNTDLVTEALTKATEAAFPELADEDVGNDSPPRGRPSGDNGAKQGSNRKGSGPKRPKLSR